MIGETPRVIENDDRGKIKLAPERFKDSGEMREVCQAMITADRPRAALRAQVDGIANGNPVYSLARLKAKGQAWRARTNYRGMEGALQVMETSYYDVNTEVNPIIRIEIDYGKGEERIRFMECLCKHFTHMILNRWEGFEHHIPVRNSEMLRHGLGAHVWPTTNNKWTPRTPRSGQLLFPEDTPTDFQTEGESFLLRDYLPAHALAELVRNEAAAKKLGWNPDLVWQLLAQSSKSGNNSDKPEDFQRAMKQGDYGTSMSRRAGAWINYLFIIENDSRKISMYAVAENVELPGYLFKKRNRFDDWPLVLFPYESSPGAIHATRGYGARSKDFYELQNRIYNAMADNVLISMYPQIKQNITNIDPDKLKLMRVGAMSVYPYGVEPSIMQFPPLDNSALALTRELQNTLVNNNQTYTSNTPEPKDRETALSFSMRAQDQARVNKSSFNLYCRNLTRFYSKVLLMAVKESASKEPWAVLAREFRQKCLDDGVPKEVFSKIVEIEAKRNIGAGSAAAKLQALSQLFQIVYPVTTEDRKIAMERDITTALVGYAETDRYARNAEDNDLPGQDDSFAVSENNDLSQGGEALAAPRQNHVRHAQRHLAKGQEIVMAVQNGELPPDQGLAMLQKIGEHVAQHLKLLEGNPMRKKEFDALYKDFLALSNIADQLQQVVAEMSDAEGEPTPEQTLSEDFQLGMAKVQADNRLKEIKVAGNEQRANRKLAFTLRSKAIMDRAKIQLQRNGSKQLALTNK